MRVLLSVIILITVSGCYHATVTTGLEPSARVIEQPFAAGWIYGLVPPKTVEAADECDNGVAIVETQLSFVNQLVSFITFGIFTPMHIKVTCASGSAMGAADIKVDADGDARTAFQQAADLAVQEDRPVAVAMR
jgi:hypothetical protein